MSPDSTASGGVRGFLKRYTHGIKKVVRPEAQAPTSLTCTTPPPPPPEPLPGVRLSNLAPTHEILSQTSAQTQQIPFLPAPAPSAGQPTLTISRTASNGVQAVSAGSSLSQVAKKVGGDAWAGLKAALRLLEKSSDVLPPLKSAVAEFLGVVDVFETAAQNREDYAKLASNLQAMVHDFAERPGEQTSSRMLEALDAMASGLRKEMEHVQEQGQRSRFGRYIEAKRDSENVKECRNRVENLRRALQDKAMLRTWRIEEERQVDTHLEKLNAALRAMYDSSMSAVIGRRMCTLGTREAILAGMKQWANNPNSPRVYWLNGMAGTGKTTLAYSFCAEMQLAGRLGASFFCSRVDADSRDVSRIVPTIAHQLARLLPSYREVLIRQIGMDKDIGARNTETQFEKLIRDPLLEIKALVPEGIVIAIDALDECDRRDGAQDILDVLFLHARDLPIKFFVTCRPEPGLFDLLQSKDEHYRSVLHLHDIEAAFVEADIMTFLEAELASIALPEEKLRRLAEQAGTLFIYAATAVRYIYPKGRLVNFHQRLEDVLCIAPQTDTNQHDVIDDLYTAVLAAPFNDRFLNSREKKNIRLVLHTAICAKEPMSVTTMTNLLELDDEQDIIYALQHLRSVLHVSHNAGVISTFHASFPDFMLRRERSANLWCDAVENNQRLALYCFNTMHRLLRFNICNLESSFVLDESIPDLAEKIGKAISPELFYACRYWGDHLSSSEASDDILYALGGFLSHRLLFWMEVLNLRNCIGIGTQMLTEARVWSWKVERTNNILSLALDAGKFVRAFSMSPASRSTPHIYVSALPFWPETRPVRQQYWTQTRGLIRTEGPAMERRDLSCLAAWKTTSHAGCVAFSPDGARIVSGSGSGDKTIHIWDARSGRLVAGPFEGHTNQVTSVGFSSDGTRIVSGSFDKVIRVWDARSGDLVAGPFEGHTSWVTSVGFSPDGTRIVSGSVDKTIRVWDARSGALVAGPFEGHISGVTSVGFSPDGTHIVSGSHDSTVRVWDARSGANVARPFEGHTNQVTSVGFSPDGTRIVSGSHDKTIRIWDARSGDLVAEPLEGHASHVNSVGFSPDGTHIVSGSSDFTIILWDARSGDPVAGPFEGHTDRVHSVGFSLDGTRVISSSRDNTIRVWDARTGDFLAAPFEGHSNGVISVGFSPGGTHVVSGSHDNTVRVWDARSGALVAEPFEGHTSGVSAVGFSPDGTRVVSGSHDNTIRVWDARSGALVAGPFEGHTNHVSSVGFSPGGTRIVSSSWDKTIRVWDARSGALVARPFEGHTSDVSSVGFSPNGTLVVSGSRDKTIRVWDAHSGDMVAGPFQGHTGDVNSVGFSPDGTLVVSGSDDKTIRVWNVRSGDLVAEPFEGHTSWVTSVDFSSDGTRIVSGSYDKTLRIWDACSGRLIAGPFEGHTDTVYFVRFSPDGTLVVSGSQDKTIRVWDATPFRVHDPRDSNSWLMDEDGMVTNRRGDLLLCVPIDLWTGLMRPHNTVCIYRKGALGLAFGGVLLGSNWVKCYQF